MGKMNILELMDYLADQGWNGEQISLYVDEYFGL